jgi:hypothetical protein
VKLDASLLPFFGKDAPSLETSGKILLTTNALAIILAVIFQYDFGVVIWSYWFESVIIGIFTFLGLILTGLYSRSILGFSSSLFYAGFFAVHYGMFHFVYFFFLIIFTSIGLFSVEPVNYIWVALTTGIFFLSHGFSFVYNVLLKKELTHSKAQLDININAGDVKGVRKELESQMTKPYTRIIPIHLTIMLSGFLAPIGLVLGSIVRILLLVIFMSLKTVGDLWAHNLKHKIR